MRSSMYEFFFLLNHPQPMVHFHLRVIETSGITNRHLRWARPHAATLCTSWSRCLQTIILASLPRCGVQVGGITNRLSSRIRSYVTSSEYSYNPCSNDCSSCCAVCIVIGHQYAAQSGERLARNRVENGIVSWNVGGKRWNILGQGASCCCTHVHEIR
jgi:hypothetical protein